MSNWEIQELQFWKPPVKWTAESANERAFEILREFDKGSAALPPELALLQPPKRPNFPPLWSNDRPIFSKAYPERHMRAVPWLPEDFDPDSLPSWKIALFLTMGAEVADLADRVDADSKNLKSFNNQKLYFYRRAKDWRDVHGGFDEDTVFLHRGELTQRVDAILKRLSWAQLLLGITWEVDTINMKMRFDSTSAWHHVPRPEELSSEMLKLVKKAYDGQADDHLRHLTVQHVFGRTFHQLKNNHHNC